MFVDEQVLLSWQKAVFWLIDILLVSFGLPLGATSKGKWYLYHNRLIQSYSKVGHFSTSLRVTLELLAITSCESSSDAFRVKVYYLTLSCAQCFMIIDTMV